MPESYIPLITPPAVQEQPALWFAFQKAEILVQDQTSAALPCCGALTDHGITPLRSHYLGLLGERHCYAAQVDETHPLPAGWARLGLRDLDGFMQKYRTTLVEARLKDRGLPPEFVRPFDLKRKNVAPPEKVGGATFGAFIPYIIIILCFSGAMYPAMDLTAGEKERGTMETLMCSPTHRINIVFGKFLMVLSASIATMVVVMLSMAGTAALGGTFFTGKVAATQAAAAKTAQAGAMMPTIDPAGLLGVFAMVAPMAIFFAALLLTVSLFAKSYKEAQSYAGPLIIVVIIPAVFGLLPGIELNAKTALVPIVNLSLVCKEMLSGTWNWPYIGLIFGSSCAYAAAGLWVCVKMFNREDVMFKA